MFTSIACHSKNLSNIIIAICHYWKMSEKHHALHWTYKYCSSFKEFTSSKQSYSNLSLLKNIANALFIPIVVCGFLRTGNNFIFFLNFFRHLSKTLESSDPLWYSHSNTADMLLPQYWLIWTNLLSFVGMDLAVPICYLCLCETMTMSEKMKVVSELWRKLQVYSRVLTRRKSVTWSVQHSGPANSIVRKGKVINDHVWSTVAICRKWWGNQNMNFTLQLP